MDSLTQIALGATVGYAVLGRRVGLRAALWGGICGTLPDLDVLVDMGGPVADFTYHRSFSHSLITLPLLVPPIVWLILKFHPDTRTHRRGWHWLALLALITHPLLDSFTIYGTQLIWPLSEYPFGLGSVFIIDPLYTLPLLIGLGIAMVWRRRPRQAQRANQAGLVLSTLYLGWSVLAQAHVAGVAHHQLADMRVENDTLLVTPAPFNTLLWRVVAMQEDGYQEGFYSLLDNRPVIRFSRYKSDPTLLDTLQQHWPVTRLQWFSKGFYKVESEERAIVISDLRMGVEPDYVFRFKVAEISNPHPKPVLDLRLPAKRNWDRLPNLIRRIWTQPKQ